MPTETTTETRLLGNYIGGRWVPAGAESTLLDVTNPATGEVLARVPLSGAPTSTPPSPPPATRSPGGAAARRSSARAGCSASAR